MAARRRPLSDAPEALPPDARARLRSWALGHLPWGDRRLGRSWVECRDWHRANGVLRYDWEAAFRNWLRKELEFEQRPRPDPMRGTRGRTPHRTSELGPLADLLGDLTGGAAKS